MPNENSFWVLYGHHTKPTFLEDAGHGQRPQRDNALEHVKQWRVCLDIGSNIGQWTRPLARRLGTVAKCESILKELGYRFVQRTKSDEIWLKS